MDPKMRQPIVHVFPGSPSTNASGSGKAPSLILLLGWMGAPLSLVKKYVTGHHTLYPSATVVLVESYTSFMWSSKAEKEEKLHLVVDILLEEVYRADRLVTGILVHAISNAGGIHLMTLSSILNARLQSELPRPGKKIPAITMAFVIDSTPGTNDYESIITTFTLTMGPAAKLAARLPLTLAYISYYIIYNTLLRNPPLLPRLHQYLGQEKLLPGAKGGEPRLYFYSDADKMVPWSSVERHLSVISKKNIPFRAEKYLGSQHVSHARMDSNRYWGAVAETWDRAQRSTQASGIRLQAKL